MKKGFTLVELSIVLVIIGLIVGGVLVGRDLIAASEIRSTISQIEKYNTAANTFRLKYGFYPGDISEPAASSNGFAARGIYAGQGDGNGIIEGLYSGAGTNQGKDLDGESLLFWTDLSTANMIDGKFAWTGITGFAADITPNTTPPLSYYVPTAKLGGGNYVYVWSGGIYYGNAQRTPSQSGNSYNYFSISALTSIRSDSAPFSNPGLSTAQAYAIDSKTDDGFPQTGLVRAFYLAANAYVWSGPNNTAATGGTSSTCYDNNSVLSAQQQYSVGQDNGTGLNCGLSFRFR